MPAADVGPQLLPERQPHLGPQLARIGAAERAVAEDRPLAAVVDDDLGPLRSDLAGHDGRQRQLLGQLLQAVVGVEAGAGAADGVGHGARADHLEAVRLQRLHHLLADQRLLRPLELGDADALAGRLGRADESSSAIATVHRPHGKEPGMCSEPTVIADATSSRSNRWGGARLASAPAGGPPPRWSVQYPQAFESRQPPLTIGKKDYRKRPNWSASGHLPTGCCRRR